MPNDVADKRSTSFNEVARYLGELAHVTIGMRHDVQWLPVKCESLPYCDESTTDPIAMNKDRI